MTSGKESGESTISDLKERFIEAEGRINEAWESIQKAIEIESNKLKERAEQDSSQLVAGAKEEAQKTVAQARQEAELESERIVAGAKEEAQKTVAQARQEAELESERLIAGAKEEAQKTVAQARQEAKIESERIIAGAEEEAQKTVAQARQEAELESERLIAGAKEEAEKAARECRDEAYAEALQESSRVISDTKEKVSQDIKEVIERSITQAKNDFTRAASEARRELEDGTSQILTQVSKSIEEFIGETKTKINAGFESLPTVITEPENRVQSCTDMNDKKGEVSSQQTTGSEVMPIASVYEQTESGVPPLGEKLGDQLEDTDDTKLFEGRLKVEVVYPFLEGEPEGMEQELAQVPGLKVMSTESYARGNDQIMAHIVELKQPMLLLKILKATMHVRDIAEHKGNIMIKAKQVATPQK